VTTEDEKDTTQADTLVLVMSVLMIIMLVVVLCLLCIIKNAKRRNKQEFGHKQSHMGKSAIESENEEATGVKHVAVVSSRRLTEQDQMQGTPSLQGFNNVKPAYHTY